ncbi:hypothetical protein NGY2020029_26190 [Vibrio cholerae]
MYISFQTKELREICECSKVAQTILGTSLAHKLQSRLSDVVAAEDFTDLPLGNPRVECKSSTEYLIINLDKDVTIGFVCGHSKPPYHNNGMIDWTKVIRVKLMFIGEYNVS